MTTEEKHKQLIIKIGFAHTNEWFEGKDYCREFLYCHIEQKYEFQQTEINGVAVKIVHLEKNICAVRVDNYEFVTTSDKLSHIYKRSSISLLAKRKAKKLQEEETEKQRLQNLEDAETQRIKKEQENLDRILNIL